MVNPVLTKQDFYRRYANSEFGNKLLSWDTWGDLLRSDYEGPIGIRSRIPGGPFVCPIPYGKWAVVYNHLLVNGVKKEDMRFSQAAPDDRCIFQAEICETYRGLEMRYSTNSGTTHREAMKTAQNVHGLRARMILRHYLEPSDFSDVEALLELYPDHVIEVSSYAFPVGNIPGRCALIWETRRY